jgi:hypothetical protein
MKLFSSFAVTAIIAIAIPANASELELELPEPYFGGTPLDYFGENLEEPNYKPRPAFEVPEGVTNVAKGKAVTASVENAEFGKLEFLTDGDKSYDQNSLLGLPTGKQWIQIDLGSVNTLYALTLWHFHEGDRVYFDVIVQVAEDAEFTEGVTTVFNNDHDNSSGHGVGEQKEYIESYKSKFLDLKGVTGRYVRFYSKGNTSDEINHYVEAEVFGKAAE